MSKTETYKTLVPEICIQFANHEIFQDKLVEKIKNQYFKDGNLEEIETLQIYIKPEEFKAYYVINKAIYGYVAI